MGKIPRSKWRGFWNSVGKEINRNLGQENKGKVRNNRNRGRRGKLSLERKRFVMGAVYEAADVYDQDYPEYNYYASTVSGEYSMGDCWVINKDGDICPGYENSPVVVFASQLGKVISYIDIYE